MPSGARPTGRERQRMLIGIPAILGPDLLYTLRAMGHGDEIAIVDANYPAQEHARRLVRADGHRLIDLLEAIVKVMPLDRSTHHAIFRAALNNDPGHSGPIHAAIDAACAKAAPDFVVKPLCGDDLYPRIRAAHTIVASGEQELYGNVILRKGVIAAQRS